MQIKLAKTAGFCFGVNRAVELLYDKVEAGERVCTLGPIIHNAQLVGDLAERGVKIIDRVEDCPPGYQIVVRTHGVDKCVVPFTDATCPFVLKIHRIVGSQSPDTTVLIAGDEDHPEVVGIRSYCPGASYVFKNAEELQEILKSGAISPNNPMICVSQTTFSLKELLKDRKKRRLCPGSATRCL